MNYGHVELGRELLRQGVDIRAPQVGLVNEADAGHPVLQAHHGRYRRSITPVDCQNRGAQMLLDRFHSCSPDDFVQRKSIVFGQPFELLM
jgi:hypothetical protein